jgi:hypothetical protein
MERQSSMASSTEEVSGPMNDLSGGSRRDEGTTEQFGVFKDFDFLEYESESVEVSMTCFVCALNPNNFLFHILLLTSLHISVSTGHPLVKYT